MATGDQNDVSTRISSTLPPNWFGDSTGVRDGLLAGLAWALSFAYGLILYAKKQTRIGTATDGFLDLIAYDFFGEKLKRKTAEMDGPYRTRILANLFRERGTRKGMAAMLTVLTGRAPVIFEPRRAADCLCLGHGGLGIGRMGSRLMPCQVLIDAYRPSGAGVANIGGLGSGAAGLRAGTMALASASQIEGQVTDEDIYAAIDAFKLAGTTCWVRIQS